MWLISQIRAMSGWLISFSRKIIPLSPGSIAIVILGTLVSQVFRLLAFFLPLKLIILIGSPGVPRYFPRAFLEIDREILVIWLGAATVGFYLLHLIAEKLIDVFADKAANQVLRRADKLAVLANQAEIALSACKKYAELVAAIIFVLLALGLLAFIHPSVAVLLAAWMATSFLITAITGSVRAGFRDWVERNSSAYLGLISAGGFFAVTILIIAEVVSGLEFNVLIAIISLLLTRQSLQRVEKLVANAIALDGVRPTVNALFFSSHVWTGAPSATRHDVWKLLAQPRLGEWLPVALAEVTGQKVVGAAMTRFYQTGFPNLLAFDAEAELEGGGRERYFVKLHGKRRELGAINEETLLGSSFAAQLPAPKLLGVARVDDCRCHVHAALGATPIDRAMWAKARLDLMARCWTVALPADFVQRYRRSHQLLHERLLEIPIERLEIAAATPAEREIVRWFADHRQEISDWLKTVPLVLYNRDMVVDTMSLQKTGSIIVTQWARWQLAPLGAGWPLGNADLGALKGFLSTAQVVNAKHLRTVRTDTVRLVARLARLEEEATAQRMKTAITMLGSVKDDAGEMIVGSAPKTRLPAITTAIKEAL
jgi:hypothetical protein